MTIPLLSCAINGEDSLSRNNRVIDEQKSIRMAGSLGLNTKIISKNIDDLIYRARDIENKMNDLMAELQDLRGKIQTQKTATVATSAPEPIIPVIKQRPVATKTIVAPQKPKQKANTPKKTYSTKQGVINVRTGMHKDKTRLVFDINGSTKHTQDYDKQTGLVTLTLPETPWTIAQNKMFKLSQLSGYDANVMGQGSVIALAVKNTSTVKTQTIKKTGNKPARLIVDLIK